jgi:predicted component of type VI protein secretion system
VTLELIVRRKNDPQSYLVVCELADRVIFGRDDTKTSPVRLEGSEISREHFALSLHENQIYIEDLSANGTSVNGEEIDRATPQRLHLGDVVEVPGYELSWKKAGSAAASAESPGEVGVMSKPEKAAGFSLKSAWSFTGWEMLICAVIVATLVLIIYYFSN